MMPTQQFSFQGDLLMVKNEMLPEEAKRMETYNSMPKALQKVADDFQKKELAAAKGIVMIRFDMGAKLKEVIAEEATYGSNAVMELAKFLGKSDTELYAYKNVATVYDRDEVLAISERPMGDGNYISWMHLTAIVEIKKAPDRKKMWDRVFNESLSATQVKSEALASMDKGSRGTGGGRKPAKPTSPLAGCQQVYNSALSFNNRVEVWQEATFDALDEIEPDKVDPMYVEKIKLALTEVETLSGNVSQVQDRLQKNLKRAENIVEKHQKEAEKAAEKAAKESAASGEDGEKKRPGRRPAPAATAA
jgi:hypothetical protein